MKNNEDYNWQGFSFPVPLTVFLKHHFWVIFIYSKDGESFQSRTEILLLWALVGIEWIN